MLIESIPVPYQSTGCLPRPKKLLLFIWLSHIEMVIIVREGELLDLVKWHSRTARRKIFIGC